jgi:hypothetical protein
MNQIIKLAVPVLTVVIGVWVATTIPNPLAKLKA